MSNVIVVRPVTTNVVIEENNPVLDVTSPGPQGAQGATGATGPKGDTGATGAAATIAVGTTTTLTAGLPATVSNSGTSSAATFNFGIPQGAKGDTGATGATGAKGDKGDTGTAATITAGSTTTLSAGSSATVTNSGTSSAAVFDFGIPQGIAGTNGTNAVYDTDQAVISMQVFG